jgi:hypothetical protein
VVPDVFPAIATADGGFIGYDTQVSGQVLTFDQNGAATGQIPSLPVQSWTGNTYQYGSVIQGLMIPFNPAGMGTLMHEILHKQAIGGGAHTTIHPMHATWML